MTGKLCHQRLPTQDYHQRLSSIKDCHARLPTLHCHQKLPNLDCHQRLPNSDCHQSILKPLVEIPLK